MYLVCMYCVYVHVYAYIYFFVSYAVSCIWQPQINEYDADDEQKIQKLKIKVPGIS